tara:strand:- start:3803 stop:4333 length:531 start_codon:yes stop_codon:yes gene_type:complete
MKEISLTKDFIITTSLPKKHSDVNFKLIRSYLEYKTEKMSVKQLNRHKDIKIETMQDITWLMDYIEGQYLLKKHGTLWPKEINIMVHDKGEGSIKRHHLNYADLKGSPDLVMLYFLETDKNDLVIEYDDGRKKGCYWTLPIHENKYVLFNSHLEYYLKPNTSNKQRLILRVTYEER